MDSQRTQAYERLEKLVGRTHLYVLNPTSIPGKPVLQHRIFTKAEYENPTGSHYDRVYVPLLRMLEKEGKIIPTKTPLIETSSGNAGSSFAWVCNELGYEATVIVPDNLPKARIEDIRKYGAQIRTTPGKDYVGGAATELRRVLTVENKERKAKGLSKFWSPNHSQDVRSADFLESIAKEIIEETEGIPIHYLILAAGNGASILGPGRVFKERSPDTRIIVWEPLASGAATEMMHPGRYIDLCDVEPGTLEHKIYGTGVANVDFPMLKQAIQGNRHSPLVDSIELAADTSTLRQLYKRLGIWNEIYRAKLEAACVIANPFRALSRRSTIILDKEKDFESNFFFWEDERRTLQKIGFNVGASSIASFALANKIASKEIEPKNFAIIFYDPAWKYLEGNILSRLKAKFAA